MVEGAPEVGRRNGDYALARKIRLGTIDTPRHDRRRWDLEGELVVHISIVSLVAQRVPMSFVHNNMYIFAGGDRGPCLRREDILDEFHFQHAHRSRNGSRRVHFSGSAVREARRAQHLEDLAALRFAQGPGRSRPGLPLPGLRPPATVERGARDPEGLARRAHPHCARPSFWPRSRALPVPEAQPQQPRNFSLDIDDDARLAVSSREASTVMI